MKTKTSLWLGVCTLVLCLGVMTFGVYSAIRANLNIGGSLGFNMHDPLINVSGTIQNVAENGIKTNRKVNRTIMGTVPLTTNLNFDEIYFYSINDNIVFELTFTNVSSTAIMATIPAPTVGTGVTIVTDSASGYTTFPVSDAIIAQNATYTIKFALRLNSLDALSNNVNFSWNDITFEEFVIPDKFTEQGLTYTLNSEKTAWSVKASDTSLEGEVTIKASQYGLPVTTIPDGASLSYGAFYNCSKLASITIPDSVTSIGNYAFFNCTGLTSVSLGNSVTSIGSWAFQNCTGLTSVTIPDSVTSIGDRAFIACTGLTSVNISSIESWCGIDFGGYFAPLYYAYNLYLNGELVTSLVIPGTVTTIKRFAFYNCTNLTSVSLGNGVTSIGNNAFSYCTGLTSINIPDSVTSIGNNAFSYCEALSSITVSTGNTKYDSRNNCNAIIETASNTLIVGCKNSTIPDSVTSIGDDAFSGCTSLTSVSLGNSVTSIGNYAFFNCTGLTSVTIPDSVTSIGSWAFEYCSGLKDVTFDGTTPPAFGSYVFDYCNANLTIHVPVGCVSNYASKVTPSSVSGKVVEKQNI